MLRLFFIHEQSRQNVVFFLSSLILRRQFERSVCLHLSTYRFLHERHEQSKQDLEGLEETVVSHYLLL